MKPLTSNELHAFLIGFSETLCPWKARYACPMESSTIIETEFHYYLAGRGCGFISLLLILIGIAKLVHKVLL